MALEATFVANMMREPSSYGPFDIVIVGAGAAGIAAGRCISDAAKFIIVEASDHLGGRCVTDLRTFGVPFDRGAHWMHMPHLNPLTKLAATKNMSTYPAPDHFKIRVGSQYADDEEVASYRRALEKATDAFDEVE